MIGLGTTIALFIPVFLVLELLTAAPGRRELRDVVRVGVRSFGRHLVYIALGCAALHFLTEFMHGRAPLW